METIAVLIPTKVEIDQIGGFLTQLGSRQSDGAWGVERDGTAIFLSCIGPEENEVRDKRDELPFLPETVLLISIDHRAEVLAFEAAAAVKDHWKGAIHWGGLGWLERNYDRWKKSK